MLRRRTYTALSVVLRLLAAAGLVLIIFVGGVSEAYAHAGNLQTAYIAAVAVAALLILLSAEVVIHELGHATAALCTNMKVVSFRLGWLRIGREGVKLCRANAAGETAVVPRSPRYVRARYFAVTFAGPLFELLYGAAVLILYCLLPMSPVLLVFVLTMPFALCEGVLALLPAQPDAGRTDGAVLLGLIRMDAETDVTLRVLTAQAMLRKGSYAALPEDLLFGAPVVREDSRAFAALTFLQYNYRKETGDPDAAARALARLESIADFLTEEERDFVQKEKNPA